jgi:hypothetical protein
MLPSTQVNHRRGHHVCEFDCSYRTLRDDEGQAVHLIPRDAERSEGSGKTLAPLLAGEPVRSLRCRVSLHEILAWHVLLCGTRQSTPVSLPDVFVPACLPPIRARPSLAITTGHSPARLTPVSGSRGKLPSPSSHRTGLVGLTSGSSGHRSRRTQSLKPMSALRPAASPAPVSTAQER